MFTPLKGSYCLLRYPSIVDAVVGNCPEDAARYLINPFCPVLQSRVFESWQENNRDHFEEVPLEQPSVIRHLGRGREPRAIARRAKFRARDARGLACH